MKTYARMSVLIILLATSDARAVIAPALPELPNFDKRLAATNQTRRYTIEQSNALTQAKARIPSLEVEFDQIVGSPRWVRAKKGLLSGHIRPSQLPALQRQASIIGPMPAPNP